ncbi:biotin-requiring enzyme [Microdochium trichocladiopsis]|uniref:Biotin-requiring enzyme n=1 Tax=Microdochium trichocladiopsis TaxID=1682393 RepID=A0A9P9BUU2_9PEZI|nr:biotin-requiring enzyme [Microdochium trichocladiopsis]KAH7037991.1 biotin-requiring enzyme [Microdochium trichocladiopsis]
MASFAGASRMSVRLVARRVAQDASRGFRSSAAPMAAHNFTMPALSPTMTEGNIASWKIKEGDSFSAGDVLLEIETDKASMDVEAQDDGILMKIIQGDGTKSIQVGSRIGVLAEAGDDISSLELPADEAKASKPEPKKEEAAAPPVSGQAPAAASGKRQPNKSGKKAEPQKYPLYPSVAHLIKENGLDDAAVSEMTPTGPQGRLLKGDVLAYLGSISEKRPAEIKARFDHNSHLDLSNIKIAAPKEAPAAKKSGAAPSAPVVEDLIVSTPISFHKVVEVQKRIEETIGTFLPLSTFITRATEMANDELPLASNYKPTADELFNQVLGLDKVNPTTSRGYYMPQVAALPTPSLMGVAPKPARSPAAKVDLIDFLAPTPKKTKPVTSQQTTAGVTVSGLNVFSLAVPAAEKKRADAFLQRVKMLLEADPGRLVL